MSAFTIDSLSTGELSFLTSKISSFYPLQQYQQNLHLKCKMQKLPIPQSHKFSLVHNVNKSQTKLETIKAPKTVKVWFFPVAQCVPSSQLREVSCQLTFAALVVTLLSVSPWCPLLRVVKGKWEKHLHRQQVHVCMGEFLGVHNLRTVEVANPGRAVSHLFLTHGKDSAIYFRLRSISWKKI